MPRKPSLYIHNAQRSNLTTRSSLAIAGVALILTACGGGGGSSDASPLLDDQNPLLGGELNDSLVQSGQFAGLNQECVDTLQSVDSTVASEFILLTCRPENIEDDLSPPVDDTVEDDLVTPLPLNPPVTIPGLNIAQPDVAGGNYYQNSRVSALLTGAVFGTGSSLNTDLVKPVAVQIDNVEPGIELIELRAMQDSNGANNADFLAVIENTSSEFLCSITLNEFSEFSSTGAQLSTDALEFALLDGEIGVRDLSDDDAFYFSSCLPSGSLGYMLSYRDVPFDTIAEIRGQELRSSSGLSQVDGAIVPVSYSVESDGSVSIIIVNNSSESLSVFSVDALAIDEQGHAFAWDSQLPLTEIAPGAELVVAGIFPRFKGIASTIRAIVNFDQP